MDSENGFKMSHSPQIDPYRKICSALTIQSDPNGHFAKIVDQLKEKTNYENALLQVRNVIDDFDNRYLAVLPNKMLLNTTFVHFVLF